MLSQEHHYKTVIFKTDDRVHKITNLFTSSSQNILFTSTTIMSLHVFYGMHNQRKCWVGWFWPTEISHQTPHFTPLKYRRNDGHEHETHVDEWETRKTNVLQEGNDTVMLQQSTSFITCLIHFNRSLNIHQKTFSIIIYLFMPGLESLYQFQ